MAFPQSIYICCCVHTCSKAMTHSLDNFCFVFVCLLGFFLEGVYTSLAMNYLTHWFIFAWTVDSLSLPEYLPFARGVQRWLLLCGATGIREIPIVVV